MTKEVEKQIDGGIAETVVARRSSHCYPPLSFGSLFAGIGGFDIGLERAGMKCKWQVERDPYCSQVLWERWPSVGKCDDVQTFPPDSNAENDWYTDVICGGFPCQDLSNAGRCDGIDGERSGLWREFARIIGTLRPRYAIVENVPALLVRGMDRVCGDLARAGYDAEWRVVRASEFGAPHERARLFIVAYAASERFIASKNDGGILGGDIPQEVAASPWERCEMDITRTACGRMRAFPRTSVYRMADGTARRLERLRVLGNAIVPCVSEWIGRRIVAAACGG